MCVRVCIYYYVKAVQQNVNIFNRRNDLLSKMNLRVLDLQQCLLKYIRNIQDLCIHFILLFLK